MSIYILMTLNIMSSIAILLLIAIGLFIIFGLMGVVNLAHGEFLMLGAYTAFMITKFGLSPWLSLFIAPIVVGLLSLLIERVLIRHLYGKVMESILATWGLSIVVVQVVQIIFGKGAQQAASPLSSTVSILGVNYPLYRLSIILFAIIVAVALLIIERKTNIGYTVRAVIDNPQLASTLGININRVYQTTFIFGGALAGLAGAIIAPIVSVNPNMGFGYVINAFLAVIVGGVGTVGVIGSSTLLGGSNSLIAFLLDPIWGSISVVIIAILFMRLRRTSTT